MKYIFFCFLYLLISCKGGQQKSKESQVAKILNEVNNSEHIPKVQIKNREGAKHIFLQNLTSQNLIMEQFIDTMYVVPLETTDQCLIGFINDLVFDGDKIIIASGTKPYNDTKAELLAFNLEGKFLNKIGKYGRAGDEYSSYNTFSILNHEVYVFDRTNSCFKVYEENGKFIRTHRLPDRWYPIDVYVMNDSTLLWYWGEGTRYVLNGEMTHYTHLLTDMAGNPIAKAFHYEQTFMSSHKNNFEKEDLLIAPFGIDTLYRLTTDREFETRYILDIPNEDKEMKRNFSQENLWKLDQAKKTYLAGGFWVNSTHMLGRVINMKPLFFIYDLINNKAISYGSVLMTVGKNKSHYDLCNNYNICAIYNDFFVSFVSAAEVVSSLDRFKNIDDPLVLRHLEAAKLDDNPLLVFYKLKSI